GYRVRVEIDRTVEGPAAVDVAPRIDRNGRGLRFASAGQLPGPDAVAAGVQLEHERVEQTCGNKEVGGARTVNKIVVEIAGGVGVAGAAHRHAYDPIGLVRTTVANEAMDPDVLAPVVQLQHKPLAPHVRGRGEIIRARAGVEIDRALE